MSPARSKTPRTGGQPSPSLVRALRHLLRPLVRLLLRNGVTLPYLHDLLRALYVEIGEAELAEPNDSRLSLLTGIHRKGLRQLRETAPEGYAPPPTVSLGARLVARWTAAPEFLDGRGRPRPLLRANEAGVRGPTFDELVASVSTDIRPRAVLDEWLRLGVVELDERDRVRLCTDAFVPARGFDEKAHYFGRNLHDHMAAAAHNLSGGDPPMLERSVYYDGLSDESVEELRALAEEHGMQALQTLNRRALALQKRDGGRDARQRMNFGVYFLRADMPPDEEPRDDA